MDQQFKSYHNVIQGGEDCLYQRLKWLVTLCVGTIGVDLMSMLLANHCMAPGRSHACMACCAVHGILLWHDCHPVLPTWTMSLSWAALWSPSFVRMAWQLGRREGLVLEPDARGRPRPRPDPEP